MGKGDQVLSSERVGVEGRRGTRLEGWDGIGECDWGGDVVLGFGEFSLSLSVSLLRRMHSRGDTDATSRSFPTVRSKKARLSSRFPHRPSFARTCLPLLTLF